MNSRNRDDKPAVCGVVAGLSLDRSLEEYERQNAKHIANELAQVGARIACRANLIQTIFDDLAQDINAAMRLKGFWDDEGAPGKLPTCIALVHSELSELLEANRKGVEHDDHIPEFTGEEAEAADTAIRLLDMAGGFRWRFGEAVVAKMLYNLSRPHKHGKAY